MSYDLPRILKQQIWVRDGYKCLYCGRDIVDLNKSGGKLPKYAATVDHIKPKSQGGSDLPENLASSCFGCNNILGDKFNTFEEKKNYIQKVLNEPHKTQEFMDLISKWEKCVDERSKKRKA